MASTEKAATMSAAHPARSDTLRGMAASIIERASAGRTAGSWTSGGLLAQPASDTAKRSIHGRSDERRKGLTAVRMKITIAGSCRGAQSLYVLITISEDSPMGRGILLWMLGVPLPVILLLAMCSHH